ncbi:MAG: primosomal protein N', partial [Candidatus Omnitrophota bacterium]
MKYASIAIKLPLDKQFTYRVPKLMEDKITLGMRVWVPFGPRKVVGYVVDLTDKSEIENTKPIESIIDAYPMISEELLKLTRWMADYYICSWGEAIDASIPGVLKKGKTSVKTRCKHDEEPYEKSVNLVPNQEQKVAIDII